MSNPEIVFGNLLESFLLACPKNLVRTGPPLRATKRGFGWTDKLFENEQ